MDLIALREVKKIKDQYPHLDNMCVVEDGWNGASIQKPCPDGIGYYELVPECYQGDENTDIADALCWLWNNVDDLLLALESNKES